MSESGFSGFKDFQDCWFCAESFEIWLILIVTVGVSARECRQLHISVNVYFRHCIFPSLHISVIPAEAGIQNPHQQCGIRSQIYPDPDYRRNDGRFDDTA